MHAPDWSFCIPALVVQVANAFGAQGALLVGEVERISGFASAVGMQVAGGDSACVCLDL